VTTSIATAIARQLSAAGNTPDPDRSRYISARLHHFGELQHRTVVPPPQLASATSLLGFGYVMTEFAIAPVIASQKPYADVLALGALANLIVCAYDALLDSGHAPTRLLRDPLIGRLVDLYFARLAGLPHAHRAVDRTLRRAIQRMYDAETATAGQPAASLREWRRKSALPFVVMGLPFWMTAPTFDFKRYREHLRWLYRLGQFFGWIDDAADLAGDRADGRLNYFCIATHPDAAQRIARCATRILQAWDAAVPPGRYTRTLRETFLAVTWAWLGAPMPSGP